MLLLVAGTVAVLFLLALLVPLTNSTPSNPSWLDRVEDLYFNLKFALSLYRQQGKGNSCISNLKQIEGAKAAWALESKKTNSDIPNATDIYGPTNYIWNVLKCPAGGKYWIGRIDQKPRCSFPGHTL